MIALANVLLGIGYTLDMVLKIMVFLVIARAVISWVNPDPFNPIVRFLVATTDPLLRPLRRFIPLVAGGIDITPIVLLILIFFLQTALAQTVVDYAAMLKHSAQIRTLPAVHEKLERKPLPEA